MKKNILDCKKCKVQEIPIVDISGINMIDSFELYHAVGLKRQNYTRWMTDTALPLGCDKKDYILAPHNKIITGKMLRQRIRYYLTIDFTISICFLMKKEKSIAIRNYLLQQNKK
jgi:phage anti-repressor protein